MQHSIRAREANHFVSAALDRGHRRNAIPPDIKFAERAARACAVYQRVRNERRRPLLMLALFAFAHLPPNAGFAAERETYKDVNAPLPPKRPAPPVPAPAVSMPPQSSGDSSAAATDCRAMLLTLGAVFQPAEMEAQADPRCAIAEPVRLESLALRDGQRVDLPDRPTLACAAAATFANFVDEALEPLVKGYFDVSISAIRTGPGFDCRTRDHVPNAKLSEHAKGLAIDIASITFAGGRLYQVGTLANAAERAFDHSARAAACGYFHTTLGPGADAFHSSHWHFDLESRGADGKSKLCQ
jgi:hypothetical protein